MSLSGVAWSRQGRHCASRPRSIKPARARTFRCLETAGRLMSKGSASSWTEVSPDASRARIARRVGSARAAKMVLRRSGDTRVPVSVFNELVKYTTKETLSRSQTRSSAAVSGRPHALVRRLFFTARLVSDPAHAERLADATQTATLMEVRRKATPEPSVEQELAEARQHSTRSSLRDAGRPARKLEGGAVRPPGALITIGYRTTRHLIVNPITSRPGCRHPSRQKARQCRHNGEKAPLHSIMTPLSSVGSWQTHLYESRQGQRAEHAVARFWPAVAASEPYGITHKSVI